MNILTLVTLLSRRESKFRTAGPTIWTPPCARCTRSTSVSCSFDKDKNILKEIHKPVSLSKSNIPNWEMRKRAKWGQNVNPNTKKRKSVILSKKNQEHGTSTANMDKVGAYQGYQGGDHKEYQDGSHQVYTAPATSPLERRHTVRSHGGRVLGKYEVGFGENALWSTIL